MSAVRPCGGDPADFSMASRCRGRRGHCGPELGAQSGAGGTGHLLGQQAAWCSLLSQATRKPCLSVCVTGLDDAASESVLRWSGGPWWVDGHQGWEVGAFLMCLFFSFRSILK